MRKLTDNEKSVVAIVAVLLTVGVLLFPLGIADRLSDGVKYESIVDRKANIIYPIEIYNVTITYTQSDNQTMIVTDSLGKPYYIQGMAIVELIE